MGFGINHLAAWAYTELAAALPTWVAGSVSMVLAVLEGIALLAAVALGAAALAAILKAALNAVYDRFIA